MKISEKGLALIREWEGCELSAYLDGGGVWTIGVGHTGPEVKRGLTISQFEADELLALDVEEHDIGRFLKVPTKQREFDAMCSLAFNIGLGGYRKDGTPIPGFMHSTVLKRHNLGNPTGAANAFRLWNKDNGRIIKGLINRREAERRFYLGEASG